MYLTFFLALCLDGHFVSCPRCWVSHGTVGGVGGSLPHSATALASLHRQVWGPLGRPADAGRLATYGDHRSLCSGCFARWGILDGHPGFTNRVGLPVGEEEFCIQEQEEIGRHGRTKTHGVLPRHHRLRELLRRLQRRLHPQWQGNGNSR